MDRLDNESHLISLTIPANDLHWVRADRELLINGKLFDVKSITIHNNTAFIKGYADEKEVILINTIKNGYQGKNSLVDFSTASFSFIFLPYFLLNREIAAEKNPLLAAEKIYFIKTDFFSSADVKIEIPPPKKSFINS